MFSGNNRSEKWQNWPITIITDSYALLLSYELMNGTACQHGNCDWRDWCQRFQSFFTGNVRNSTLCQDQLRRTSPGEHGLLSRPSPIRGCQSMRSGVIRRRYSLISYNDGCARIEKRASVPSRPIRAWPERLCLSGSVCLYVHGEFSIREETVEASLQYNQLEFYAFNRLELSGVGGWTPSSCLQTLKLALNFNPWTKFQTFRQLTSVF